MTAKEKAKELVDKMYVGFIHDLHTYKSKKCALITVDEILDFQLNTMKWSPEHNGNIHYWQEVRKEIEKL